MKYKHEDIKKALKEGLSYGQIFKQFGCSKSTIYFHANKAGLLKEENKKSRKRVDWLAAQQFYDRGFTVQECADKFGFSLHSWYTAIMRGKVTPSSERHLGQRRRAIYDWGDIQTYYDQGYTVAECATEFGFSLGAWKDAVSNGKIVSAGRRQSRNTKALSDLLVQGERRKGHIRGRIIKEGLIPYVCSRCGVKDWLGEAISLHLDHINGDRTNHSLANLRWLCPNCHSQTPTYGSKNLKLRRLNSCTGDAAWQT